MRPFCVQILQEYEFLGPVIPRLPFLLRHPRMKLPLNVILLLYYFYLGFQSTDEAHWGNIILWLLPGTYSCACNPASPVPFPMALPAYLATAQVR